MMHNAIIRNRCSKANQTILEVSMAFVIAYWEDPDDTTYSVVSSHGRHCLKNVAT